MGILKILSYWRELLIAGLALTAVVYYSKYRSATTTLTDTSKQLSASIGETLVLRNKASQIERVVETETIQLPGKTVTRVVEREKASTTDVVIEKQIEVKIEEKIVERRVEVVRPVNHLFSVSLYKTADFNIKSWQLDLGLKVDAIDADVVIGTSGDITKQPSAYYGGLRWQW